MGKKIFTRAEVAKHNAREDLYMIIDGKVYDCTKFGDEHPGGVETLMDVAGVDATSEFDAIGHSSSAKRQMASLLVGEVDPSELKQQKKAEQQGSSGVAIAACVLLGAYVAFEVYNHMARSS